MKRFKLFLEAKYDTAIPVKFEIIDSGNPTVYHFTSPKGIKYWTQFVLTINEMSGIIESIREFTILEDEEFNFKPINKFEVKDVYGMLQYITIHYLKTHPNVEMFYVEPLHNVKTLPSGKMIKGNVRERIMRDQFKGLARELKWVVAENEKHITIIDCICKPEIYLRSDDQGVIHL